MRRPMILASLLLALQSHAQPAPLRLSDLGDAVPARQQEFFPAPSFELVHSGGCGVMEGVASASDGSVYFTEITRSVGCSDAAGVQGGRIWVVPPGGKPRIFLEPSNMAAGLAIDAQDRLVTAEGADYGGRRVSITDLHSGSYRVVAYFHESRQFNAPNDVAIDRAGRIYFSDLRLFGPETLEQRINAVYRLDPARNRRQGPVAAHTHPRRQREDERRRTVARRAHAACRPVRSRHQRARRAGHARPRPRGHGRSGSLSARRRRPTGASRVLLDLEKAGCVDGMITDVEGNVYLALPSAPSGPGIYVMTPNGELAARLPLPNRESPVNLGFGRGPEAGTLYVATVGVGNIYRLRAGKAGLAPTR
ncbi:SMP-30/gluconolactonase/LRE family protein [Variovorax sp. LjRoot84]|uniref:SMP-30/gluconolactonase/LRE family protein n=1 Tax=Variovorax sp. LjRoot84 TaxID=3342340 RepID=UPI003ECE400F